MTNGTSQGLFIVVAIVIFGIFVLMSYILFEDTLSPAMASMFTDATEQSIQQLNENTLRLGTWLWTTTHIVNKPDEVIQNLKDNNVKDLYLQVNITVGDDYYHYFVKEANKNGIKIHILDGSTHWSDINLTAQERLNYRKQFFDWVAEYQKNAPNESKFNGIHLDVEPNTIAGFWDNSDAFIEAYQEFVTYAVEESNRLGLPLALDIPAWFGELEYNTTYGSGNIVQWLVDMKVEELAIMAFRDTATGPNSITDKTREEFQIAGGSRTKISISVETDPSYEGQNITFFEEGEAHMMGVLKEVKDHLKGNRTFNNFNIHHYDAWENLSE